MDSDQYLRGISLFNNAEFFDAHEALEDIWRAAPPENKKFLQGMVQVAVAFHHYSTLDHDAPLPPLPRIDESL